MKVVIFAGPTIAPAAVTESLPSVNVQPPAACGDIYRCCRDESIVAIGLIDGYFDHRLSVWHKEILWALDRGVHVYGSASMGALRAAELATFGMKGVGKVFQQFLMRELEDDDEVAVVHEPAERDYAVRSDALVNLRETLSRAVASGVMEDDARIELVTELKRLFYPLRTRQALMHLARRLWGDQDSAPLIAWVEKFGVADQKRTDAVDMLRQMSADLRQVGLEKRAATADRFFEYTNAWHALRETIDGEAEEAMLSGAPLRASKSLNGRTGVASASQAPTPSSRDVSAATLLERIRLDAGDSYGLIVAEAIERAFALTLSELEGAAVDAHTLQAESERFRQERGLLTPEETARWLSQYGMDVAAFSALIHDNVLSSGFAEKVRHAAMCQVPNVLRNRGFAF